MLQAADLGKQRAALALKTGNLAGGIALGGTASSTAALASTT
ncbi:MAG: hypothetical protein ACLTYW_02185 [Collinsella sp.]